MTRTLTVEGDITGVGTRTALTTQGSVTSPSLIVPKGVRKISKIVVATAQDAAAQGAAVFVLRLSGPGVLKGEQSLIVGAAGNIAVQSGGDGNEPALNAVVLHDIDIDVSASDTITISGEMAGEDLGTARMGVTLVFA